MAATLSASDPWGYGCRVLSTLMVLQRRRRLPKVPRIMAAPPLGRMAIVMMSWFSSSSKAGCASRLFEHACDGAATPFIFSILPYFRCDIRGVAAAKDPTCVKTPQHNTFACCLLVMVCRRQAEYPLLRCLQAAQSDTVPMDLLEGQFAHGAGSSAQVTHGRNLVPVLVIPLYLQLPSA